MKRRLLMAAAVVAPLACGMTLALAKPRTAARAVRASAPGPARKVLFDRRTAADPDPVKLAAEARARFDNAPYEGNVVRPAWDARGEARDLQNGVAGLIQKAGVPADRPAHYQRHLNDPDLRHRGWDVTVKDVTPADGGFVVTVEVAPILDSMKARRPVAALPTRLERYFAGGGGVRYLGSGRIPGAVDMVILD